MARLRQMEPRLTALAPRVAFPAFDTQGHSKDAEPWRGWFSLARWRRLRWRVLLRDLFTCQLCHRVEADTAQLVADHVEQHRGDPILFWDEDNLQTLCAPCHNSAKQRRESVGTSQPGG